MSVFGCLEQRVEGGEKGVVHIFVFEDRIDRGESGSSGHTARRIHVIHWTHVLRTQCEEDTCHMRRKIHVI
jgi:hypothetical protein